MRIRSVWFYVFSLLFLTLVLGCSKSEAPKQETPVAATTMAQPTTPGPPTGEAVEKGQALFEQKCSQCHDLKRATSRTETKEKWAEIVKQMQGKPGSGISDADGEKILNYLTARHIMTSKGEALFEQECSKCHGLERVTSSTATKKKWAEILKEMEGKPGSGISDADEEKILDYIITQHKTAPGF